MAEEENPFLIKPKPANAQEKKDEPKIEEFSFMVDPTEAKKIHDQIDPHGTKPHYEKAGTPIWDKKDVKDIDNPDYEVVDHTKMKKEDEET
ncbi:MAG: hypothetical protein ACMUIE_00790 [Thermoplasmatota archaeon]